MLHLLVLRYFGRKLGNPHRRWGNDSPHETPTCSPAGTECDTHSCQSRISTSRFPKLLAVKARRLASGDGHTYVPRFSVPPAALFARSPHQATPSL